MILTRISPKRWWTVGAKTSVADLVAQIQVRAD